jgi:hypothetical protein
MGEVDYVEVGRVAYQLTKDHGPEHARLYAARLAQEAEAEGKTNEAEFWKAVAGELTPR